MSSPAAPVRHAPLDLWRIAEGFLGALYTLFGAPEDVARRDTYTRKPYELLAAWIRCGEALLRRLLLIEAAHVELCALRRRSRSRERRRKLMHFSADDPEAWRVSFRCLSSTVRQAQGDAEHAASGSVGVRLSLSKPTRHEPKRFYSAWPLAERYEALIRVFNNPAPYARRLARRLGAAPQRIAAIFALPKGSERVFTPGQIEAIDAVALPAKRRLDSG